MVTETAETFVPAKEAAKILGVSTCTIYRWRRRGWIDGVTLPNGTIRIPNGAIERILYRRMDVLGVGK
jgi:predicted site-specific integrase-resolvase